MESLSHSWCTAELTLIFEYFRALTRRSSPLQTTRWHHNFSETDISTPQLHFESPESKTFTTKLLTILRILRTIPPINGQFIFAHFYSFKEKTLKTRTPYNIAAPLKPPQLRADDITLGMNISYETFLPISTPHSPNRRPTVTD